MILVAEMGTKFHPRVGRICLEPCIEEDSEAYQGEVDRAHVWSIWSVLAVQQCAQPTICIQCIKLHVTRLHPRPVKPVSQGGARTYVFYYCQVNLIVVAGNQG